MARRLKAESADDLVQECLLLAWRNFHQFQPGSNIRAWLFRILFNAFYGEGRKLRRIPEVIPISSHVRSVPPGIDNAVEVNEALSTLPLEQRAVLMLAVVEGFTCAEIAGIMSIPIGTVMSRLSRARQSMRAKLSPKSAPEYPVKEIR